MCDCASLNKSTSCSSFAYVRLCRCTDTHCWRWQWAGWKPSRPAAAGAGCCPAAWLGTCPRSETCGSPPADASQSPPRTPPAPRPPSCSWWWCTTVGHLDKTEIEETFKCLLRERKKKSLLNLYMSNSECKCQCVMQHKKIHLCAGCITVCSCSRMLGRTWSGKVDCAIF